MKVKIFCLEAKYNANNMQLLTQVTNSLTQTLLVKITHLSLFFAGKNLLNPSSRVVILHFAPWVPTTLAFRRPNWHISMELKASVLNLYLVAKLQLLFRMEKGLAYSRTSLLFLALLISITKGTSFTYKPCLDRSY